MIGWLAVGLMYIYLVLAAILCLLAMRKREDFSIESLALIKIFTRMLACFYNLSMISRYDIETSIHEIDHLQIKYYAQL